MQIFLSYAHSDRTFAGELASKLTEAGYKPWSPGQDLFPGDNYPEMLGKALAESDAMVVILTPESVQSEWVLREVDFALGSVNYKNRVVPVVVEETEEIPWILRNFQPISVGADAVKVSQLIIERLGKETAGHHG